MRASDEVRRTAYPERRIREIEADFASYIEAITDQTGSVRLPTGEIVPKVPFSVLWLVESDAFIGEASIRHELNAHLLEEGGFGRGRLRRYWISL